MRTWWVLVFSVMLGACSQKRKQVEDLARPPAAAQPRSLAQASKPSSAVSDLLPVGGDTLVAVKWHGGLALTTDGGRQWRALHDDASKPDYLFFKYLTIDQHQVLWGLDSWAGIHEPSYSRLAYSMDFGTTWTHQAFDTHTFFPYQFYSSPGQALQVVTLDGKVYELHDRVSKQWKLVQAIAELDHSVNDLVAGDSYFAGARFKFLEMGHLFSRSGKGWEPVVTAGFINEVDDVCACQGSTYITGQNRAADPPIHYLIRATQGQVQDTIRRQEQEEQLRCDGKGRLWLFNSKGIWEQTGKQFLKRY